MNQRISSPSGDEREEKYDYYHSQHRITNVPTVTSDDLDVHTLFTTSQISLCPKYISKVLFFNEFMIFLEQNQLYLCQYYDYDNVTCIHEELIIDICVMNVDFNQILILQENGDISVLFIFLQDSDLETSFSMQRRNFDEMSDLGESKLDQANSPLMYLRNYSSAKQSTRTSRQTLSPVRQQEHSREHTNVFSPKPSRKIPSVVQEPLKINVGEFGFILTPQMIFANSIYGAPNGGVMGDTASSPHFGIKIQYFGNSSMLVISNQIKCTILQLQVNESDASITIDQYIDIEDQFLSHSIISTVWISAGFYHIISCNNDSLLTVTIIPKHPEQFQPREEDLKILAFSEKGEDDLESLRSDEVSRPKKALFDQRRLTTRHNAWISALSTCSGPNCMYGISGDIDGELILWCFNEKDYQFVNTELMIKRQQMRRRERLEFYGGKDSLAFEQDEENEIDSMKSASSKNHWQILWHDKLLSDHHEITMIRLEAYRSSSSSSSAAANAPNNERDVHYYAYIGNSHGKLIVLQLFAKSYQVLHELYLFSSLGEVSAIHITFEEKALTTSTTYPFDNLSAPSSFQSPASQQKTHQTVPQTVTQQRLRIFSSQSSEAVECILHKHIASIIKLLPTLSMDNRDMDSLYEMFFAGEDFELFPLDETKGFTNTVSIADSELQSPVPVTTTATSQLPPSSSNQPFTAAIRQLQNTIEFPHYQYSRFYQYNRQNQFQTKTFTTSLKAYSVLLDKDMIVVTDWIQYLYLYDLFSGQLIHTIEMKAKHCNQLACFEYSMSPTASLIGKNRNKVIILSGHQNGMIEIYELFLFPVKQKSKNNNKKQRPNRNMNQGTEMSRRPFRPSNTSTLPSSKVRFGYDLERDEDDLHSNEGNEEDEEENEEENDDDDLSIGSNSSNKKGRLRKEEHDLPVFDLLDDSANPFERRYSLETEEDLGGGLGGNESQTTSIFTTEPSVLPTQPPRRDQNPLQRFHDLTGSSRQYSCQSKLLLTIPSIHCPANISHFFFSSHGNFFVSIHLQKYLFLYSTHPPENVEQLNHTLNHSNVNTSRRRSTVVSNLRSQTGPNPANKTSHATSTAKGLDSRTLILKFHTFEEGLKQITLLQPLHTEDFSYNHHSQSNSKASIRPEDQIERLILVLQYSDRIELFNALTCETLTKMSLHDTTVESLLKASYLWYYQRGETKPSDEINDQKENVLIGLSVAELSSLYTCSYGKGFEKIRLAQPVNTLSIHGHPATASWEYLLQGMNCFSNIASPLLSLWSMKRCSLLRVHFQPQNDSVHLMRVKQFETKPMPTNKYAFLEIMGVQSLKIASWIRNHRGIIILSNGYAVIVRF